MTWLVRVTAVLMIVMMASASQHAHADYWTRADRPWTYKELRQDIARCRILTRRHSDIGLFVDVLMGQEIDKCMYAKGWIGVAR